MRPAYIDTSVLVAIVLSEQGWEHQAEALDDLEQVMSSNLLEAELRAACAREEKPVPEDLVASIDWILPDRPLGPEMNRVLDLGYLKGADVWHLAAALSVVIEPSEIAFVTLDTRQAKVAKALGFRI